MTTSALAVLKAVISAQSAYGLFETADTLLAALTDPQSGQFSDTEARRYLGLAPASNEPFSPSTLLSYQANDGTGFSASLFSVQGDNTKVLAIRGTDGAADFLQDAKLAVIGFASEQAISLYRYYRRLTTPGGQSVQYTAGERALILALGAVSPSLNSVILTTTALAEALSSDVGVARADGAPGSVLDPNERLIVTGHSLGGHLALLFGRLFPQATDQIYTFNAPGIAPWGSLVLDLAGIGPLEAGRVTNVVSDAGLDLASAFPSRRGTSYRVFTEGTTPKQAHSIVSLADSLAMYDVLAALSPSLGANVDGISSILAAASWRNSAKLETTLDMLRSVFMGDPSPTLIASAATDQNQRNDYYTRLYELRDTFAGTDDWHILPLAGLPAGTLFTIAASDMAARRALVDLTPFEVGGLTTGAELARLSDRWLSVRSDFLSDILEARTAERRYGRSGTSRNYLFIDAAQDLRFSLVGTAAEGGALSNAQSESGLDTYLAGLSYAGIAAFGAGGDDTLQGGAGDDYLFGADANDMLAASAGDDLLEGGAGTDTLEGGDGYDIYYADLEDTIRDSDGVGEIHVGDDVLSGGVLGEDGRYRSGGHAYSLSGGTLIVDDGLRIENFANGDLGIHLTAVPDASWSATASHGLDDPDGNLFSEGYAGHDLYVGGPNRDAVGEWVDGDDVFQMGDGRDFVYGGSGADWIEGGTGENILLGGSGDDTILADSPDADIDASVVDHSRGLLPRSVLSGGTGDDILFGSTYDDFVEGGPGANFIVAGSGHDVIWGNGAVLPAALDEQADTLAVVVENWGFSWLGVPLTWWPGADPDDFEQVIRLQPPSNPDQVDLAADLWDAPGGGDNTISAGPGNDWVYAGHGNDDVHGDAGNDTIYGGPGADTLYGDAGNDQLHGGAGSDALYGGQGSDSLYGEGGSDVFDGGPGADTYVVRDGGTYVLRHGGGVDTVVAEAGPAATGTILFEDADPGEVALLDYGDHWGLYVDDPFSAEREGIEFAGGLASWTDIDARFSDGTTWSHADLLAHQQQTSQEQQFVFGDFSQPQSFQGTASLEIFGGGYFDDTYYESRNGGSDAIYDLGGQNSLVFTDVSASDVRASFSGNDIVLRYSSGEVRLIAQESGAGVESVVFEPDGMTWSRSELEAHAAGEVHALGVVHATSGTAFSFQLPDNAFGETMAPGSASYSLATIEGDAPPAWLHFDADTATFSGTPSDTDVGVTSLLIAARDYHDAIGVAPVVFEVEAGTSESTSSGDQTPQQGQTAEAPAAEAAPPVANGEEAVDTPATADSVSTASEAQPEVSVHPGFEPHPPSPPATTARSDVSSSVTAAAADSEAAERSSMAAAQVGRIEDPVYNRIGDLLSSASPLHASSFMDRYVEAVREFQERQSQAPSSSPPETQPTDEELGAYNAALHAWLDRDAEINSASLDGDVRSGGAPQISYASIASRLDELLGIADGSFSRPDLRVFKNAGRPPGLSEGIANLSA